MRIHAILPPVFSALVLGLACGCSSSSNGIPQEQPDRALPASTAVTLATAVMGLEAGTSATNLPSLAPVGEGAFALIMPPSPSCIDVANHGTGPDGFTEWAWTFHCTGPDNGSLTGTITLRFNPQGLVNVAYANFRLAKGTQSWTYNGTRALSWNHATHRAAVTAAGLTLVVTDTANPSANAAYIYNASYVVDASVVTAPKLWGTFSFAANGTTTTGMISEDKALTWNPGCCYPLSGTLLLARGPQSASVAFTSTCGTISVTPTGQAPVTHTLPACSW